MADNPLHQQGLYLSPNQQDLLLAALSSNNPPKNPPVKQEPDATPAHRPSASFGSPDDLDPSLSGYAYGNDDSPFLDFNPDDLDFQGTENLIGDLPDSYLPVDEYELGDKRKSMGGKSDTEEGGKKRRESEEKVARKPGRKPLTSEPTTKRKAQNRAAQRAFRERKEKHVKDLEIKVEELQKLSDSTNQENGLLRAQVDRMQAELQQYRGRLSLLTHGNGASAMGSSLGSYPKGLHGASNDFLFDFPKFGELPGSHLFNNGKPKGGQNQKENVSQIPGILRRDGLGQPSGQSAKSSPQNPAWASPASRAAKSGSGAPTSNSDRNAGHPPHANPTRVSPKQTGSANDTSNSDSPSSSSDSHQSQLLSSNGTSPESSPNFADKPNKDGRCDKCKTAIDGEKSFCDQLGLACGNINNPVPAMQNNSGSASNTPHHTKPGNSDLDFGLDFLTQQNGGQFDPVLFGDWREPQDAILSQDFGSYFNDAFPLPDLGSPSHNFAELDNAPAKKDPTPQADNKLDEEVVPGEDKSQMLTCTKIWDRLQSMDKFRNGEIDVDNLCSELRTKARCSEGGVVVNQKDVDDIMGKK